MEGSTARTHSMIGIVIVLACLMASCGGSPSSSETTPHASASYLGQRPPGETPEPFAPGIVNTDAIELNGVVSPDGREFFFTRVIADVFVIERQADGGWSLATALPAPVNTPDYRESYPSVVADGSFDEPVNLGPPVNSEHSEGDSWDEADAGDVYWVDATVIETMRP